jgi:hypothetical protein
MRAIIARPRTRVRACVRACVRARQRIKCSSRGVRAKRVTDAGLRLPTLARSNPPTPSHAAFFLSAILALAPFPLPLLLRPPFLSFLPLLHLLLLLLRLLPLLRLPLLLRAVKPPLQSPTDLFGGIF